MKKRVKGICTLLLAGALVASLLPGLPSARAAVAVDTSKEDCSIKISVGDVGSTYTEFVELRDKAVNVNLYKVADIDATGAYTATDDFAAMDFGYIEYDSEGTSKADAWSERAADAAELVTDDTQTAAEITIGAGKTETTQEGLGVGLYLVMPEKLVTDYYTYTFAPFLVSLPNNYYYTTGDDTWDYDIEITLKKDQQVRLGNLEMTKALSDWSSTAGSEAMFIFEISYTAPDGDSETWQEAMTFTAAGSKSLEIKNIPAGSKVTVTEIYSGAAYTVSGDATVTAEVVANDEDSTAAPVAVTITNIHNNTPNGGSGLINHYETNSENQYQDPTHPDSTGGRTVVDQTQTTEETEQTEQALD